MMILGLEKVECLCILWMKCLIIFFVVLKFVMMFLCIGWIVLMDSGVWFSINFVFFLMVRIFFMLFLM